MVIYQAEENLDIPEIDLLTYIFDYGCAKEYQLIHVEANNPSLCYTKAQARTLLKRLACTLRHDFGIGIKGPGKDIVTVFSSGSASLPTVFYGIIAAGGIHSGAPSSYTVPELVRHIKDGPSNLVICSSDAQQVAVEAARKSGIPLDRVLIFGQNPNFRIFNAIGHEVVISSKELEWSRVTNLTTLEDTVACILYSSGTTGLPKGVCLSHRNIVAQAFAPGLMLQRWDVEQIKAGHRPYEYRILSHLPVSHIAGLQCFMVNSVAHGGTTFWMQKFDFVKFLEYNAKFRPTFMLSVPPIYLLIAKSPAVKKQFVSIRFAATAAAPLGPEQQKAASEKLGGPETNLVQTWGLTETCGSATLMPIGQHDPTSASVSQLFPNVTLRLVDEDNKDVASDDVGEILLKGPQITKCYHNKSKATEETFHEGWFKTGDIGMMKNGLLHIVDRKKELIKYKGNQVAPAELEALLLSHPDIADAAVIGIQGEGTELPRAYVVADKNKLSEEQIKDYVKGQVSHTKQLRGGVKFVDAIPKSPSGKILRRLLRDQAAKEVRARL